MASDNQSFDIWGLRRRTVPGRTYMCGECGDVFWSPQALGGHKTKHRIKIPTAAAHEHNSSSAANQGEKVYECEICHDKFRSGQALGGHKRRHWDRSTATSGATSSNGDRAFSIPGVEVDGQSDDQSHVVPIIRDFDLNFPPPTSPELDLCLKLG